MVDTAAGPVQAEEQRSPAPRLKQAVGDIRGVVRSPRKAPGVVGGGMASQLIYAFTLGLSLAAGLIAYGEPPEVAGAAAITARLVTFHLPPIWGWGAFRWLSRHDYL